MDAIGALIANLHQFLGHDKAAAVLGVRPGDPSACLICIYQASPTPETKQAVVNALKTPACVHCGIRARHLPGWHTCLKCYETVQGQYIDTPCGSPNECPHLVESGDHG